MMYVMTAKEFENLTPEKIKDMGIERGDTIEIREKMKESVRSPTERKASDVIEKAVSGELSQFLGKIVIKVNEELKKAGLDQIDVQRYPYQKPSGVDEIVGEMFAAWNWSREERYVEK